MQIRRARSFVLAQLRAYLENGGHRLSSTSPVVMVCVAEGLTLTHHVNSHNAHTVMINPSSTSWKRHS